jgi:hypothetical protein
MITIYTGLPGSGKTLELAKVALQILKRNKKFFDESGIRRKIWSNVKFSEEVHEHYGDFIEYWTDLAQVEKLRDVDVFMDEMASYFDSTQWANMPLSMKRWLQLHRHYGIEVYGVTQEFAMIDISVRRLTNKVYILSKLFGSRDPSPTKAPVKKVFGLIVKWEVDPETFGEDKFNYKYQGFELGLIRRKYVDVYDTRAEIEMGAYPPLQHIERYCPVCGKVHVTHR